MKTGQILRSIGVILLSLGSIGIILSIILGQIEIFLVLIIPVFQLRGAIPLVSFLMILLGSFILFISLSLSALPARDIEVSNDENGYTFSKGTEWGGIIMIGPIPIIIGSTFSKLDTKFKFAYVISLSILMIVILILSLIILFGK